MTELELKQLLSRITRPDETARTAAHAHWASLAKPLGGLGRLETMLEDAAALTGTAELAFSRRAVLVLCADNGVVAQGVSQTDQSVTRAVAENLAARRTSVCQMAKTARCEVVPVDLGMAGEPVPGVQNCRIAAGTADFTTGPAMTRQQAVDAIAAGMGLVRAQKAAGVQLLATGEMGIGNTTTSSACRCSRCRSQGRRSRRRRHCRQPHARHHPRCEGRRRSGCQGGRSALHPRGHEDGERDLRSLRWHRFLRRSCQGRCCQPRRRSVRHRLNNSIPLN